MITFNASPHKARKHNAALQQKFEKTQPQPHDKIFSAEYFKPAGALPSDKLLSYKVGNFDKDDFDWRNLSFPSSSSPSTTREQCQKFHIKPSGMKLVAWQHYLKRHPNPKYVSWILRSILEGAPLGYKGPRQTLLLTNNGMDKESWDAVEKRVREETSKGRSHIFGTTWPVRKIWPFDAMRGNRTFTVPKLVGFRVIDDLSQQKGESVNDWIDKAEFPVRFSTFLDAIRIIRENKGKIWMWQRDLKDAYRQILINPNVWFLQGLQINNVCSFSAYLLFGGTPGPGIFERFSYDITWIAVNHLSIKWLLHLLDDFQGMNTTKTGAETDATNFDTLLAELGVLQNDAKRVNPTRTIKYLGIWICTLKGIIFMDKDRVAKDRKTIIKYMDAGWATKKQMERLLGRLIWTTFVFRNGKTFLKRLYHQTAKTRENHHRVRINTRGTKNDLLWWKLILPKIPSRNIMIDRNDSVRSRIITTFFSLTPPPLVPNLYTSH